MCIFLCCLFHSNGGFVFRIKSKLLKFQIVVSRAKMEKLLKNLNFRLLDLLTDFSLEDLQG